tara:strand:+ start:9040 stop:9219 length:180 start_codon:yes stop_codon:yes gene_type:complete
MLVFGFDKENFHFRKRRNLKLIKFYDICEAMPFLFKGLGFVKKQTLIIISTLSYQENHA